MSAARRTWKREVLRAIGDPIARFTEDKLRILRAVRIATRFDLAIDPATLAAAQRMASQIRAVSPERIAEELRKLLTHPNRARGVRLLGEFRLIEPILPELAIPEMTNGTILSALWSACRGRRRFPWHSRHSCTRSANTRPSKSPIDFGSRPWRRPASHGSSRTAVPRRGTDHAVKQTEDDPGSSWHRRVACPSPRRCGRNGKSLEAIEFCERMLRETPPEELNPPPVLTGQDLITAGLKPGPEFKRILDAVREAQLEGRIRTRADAMTLARELMGTQEPTNRHSPEGGNPGPGEGQTNLPAQANEHPPR